MPRNVVFPLLLILLLAPWPAAQAGPAGNPAATPAAPPAPPFALHYGYCGASASDSLAIFDLNTWTLFGTLNLLPEGDYPYDATIRPDGSEVWITPTAWFWDFGDGIGQSNAQHPTYLYADAGLYTVTLTASNACGSDTTAGGFVALAPPCLPVETAAISGPLVLEAGQEGLYGASYTPPTATQPVTITWDNSTLGASAVYSWTVPGNHTIAITVTNPCATVGATLEVEVQSVPLYYRIYLPLIVRG